MRKGRARELLNWALEGGNGLAMREKEIGEEIFIVF